ncbi:DUF1036 domain-containing protein [Amycolatopsis sp., V23-08]|uniref:DUF1036 domain-containing protein n=1 Tax=Amycolatopsis heterodermiae TaxID=3110235 RepID=A0ABU5QY19_9PSEU|nr:DUF1036 domain-containing protein [Amycolatopsis sp., V23-08]MEA5358324.1 DUF1036 domain-containing protein [Amycolatopsis sp., V23-08]
MIDPFTAAHVVGGGYRLYKWLQQCVECGLTVHNKDRKALYFAVCWVHDKGSESWGWYKVPKYESRTIGVPVPRIGSSTFYLYARNNKGERWSGTKNFYVANPQGKLVDGQSFTVVDAATNSPELVRNQGVSRLAVVSGTAKVMTGDDSFSFAG